MHYFHTKCTASIHHYDSSIRTPFPYERYNKTAPYTLQRNSTAGAAKRASDYLRATPHRMALGRIYLKSSSSSSRLAAGGAGGAGDGGAGGSNEEPVTEPREPVLANVSQHLDLWTGVLHSNFTMDGNAFAVTTAIHPTLDAIAIRVVSLLQSTNDSNGGGAIPPAAGAPPPAAALAPLVGLDFPYPSSDMAGGWSWSHQYDSWHTSKLEPASNTVVRDANGARYNVRVTGGAKIEASSNMGRASSSNRSSSSAGDELHSFVIAASASQLDGGAGATVPASPSPSPHALEAIVHFMSPECIASEACAVQEQTVDEVIAATASHWKGTWQNGAALDLSGSTDKRAPELERYNSTVPPALSHRHSIPSQEPR